MDKLSEADVQALVDQLHSPSTRRHARRKLVRAGAVDALLGCLDARNESVAWAAVQSLGEIGSPEAVAPLIELLERGTLIADVAEALSNITGEELGTNAEAWRRWSKSQSSGAAQLQERLNRAGAHLGVKPRQHSSGFAFDLPQPGNRTQHVRLYSTHGADGEPLLVIYSVCGPADEKHYEAVLRKNLSIPSGAFGIRDVDGVASFVLVDTVPAGALAPHQMARSIENIAARADLVERGLLSDDVH